MAVKDVFKVSGKTFLDPRAWIGYDMIKENTSAMWGVTKEIFTTTETPEGEKETFEQAAKRLKLTEKDILLEESRFFKVAIAFLLFSIMAFLVGIILILDGSISGLLISLSVTLLLLSQAFRYHFYYFQIKSRKLGCTFAEWRRELF